jgi:hypothetical protein
MPPSGFSVTTAMAVAAFIGGCRSDLQQEVRDGKHLNFNSGRVFEVGQIKKALFSTSDPLKRAVLKLVMVAYEQDLSADAVAAIVSSMHIDGEGNLIERLPTV